MAAAQTNVDALVDEYEVLTEEALVPTTGPNDYEGDQMQVSLVKWAGWTEQGADALTALARDCGVFVLRNALALAIALDVEDGELGL